MSTLRVESLNTTQNEREVRVVDIATLTQLTEQINTLVQSINLGSVKRVNTVADMLALDGTKFPTVQTSGYSSVYDGGGGIYTYNAAAKDTNDYGLVINGWTLVHAGVASLKQFGAKGDATTNDTVAVQRAIDATAGSPARLGAPPGTYLLTAPITLPTVNVQLIASGNNVAFAWGHAGHLFTATSPVSYHHFEKFKVISTVTRPTATPSYVFNYAPGVVRSNYKDIEVIGDGVAGHEPYGFFYTDMANTQDTLNFDNIELNGISGIGYNFAQGSSVWIIGGRVIGLNNKGTTSIGMLFNGNMGGVWIWGTDCINLGVGIWTTANSGSTNREIFLSQFCADSCGKYGYQFSDSAYVSGTGIWAASCQIANIQCDTGFTGTINFSGGTVFNGGAYEGTLAGDGMVINGGNRVVLNGIHFRNNKGFGIRHPQAARPTTLLMTGCLSTNNANNSIGGLKARVDGCFFQDNTNVPTVVSASGNCKVTNTVGINDTVVVGTPAMPASNTDVVVGTYIPVVAYINAGSVSAIKVNGVQVLSTSNVSVLLSPGDTISITYTAAPTWTWVRADH